MLLTSHPVTVKNPLYEYNVRFEDGKAALLAMGTDPETGESVSFYAHEDEDTETLYRGNNFLEATRQLFEMCAILEDNKANVTLLGYDKETDPIRRAAGKIENGRIFKRNLTRRKEARRERIKERLAHFVSENIHRAKPYHD